MPKFKQLAPSTQVLFQTGEGLPAYRPGNERHSGIVKIYWTILIQKGVGMAEEVVDFSDDFAVEDAPTGELCKPLLNVFVAQRDKIIISVGWTPA